ncbi:MAG: glycosyltransferase [Bacteroidales bacterium]|nr:glycosyltransferase [Bacteroidales bacterium]
MTPFLSFIVPVFNVEEYLPQCLDSIYSKGLEDDEFEIVCIEDCSSDNSSKILRQYQDNHSNLTVIFQACNQGLSVARNTGLLNAKGRYVWFVDSDDFLSEAPLSATISLLRNNSPDVLLFNYSDFLRDGSMEDHIFFVDSSTMEGRSFVERFFGDSFVYHIGYVWRVIYRRLYLNEIDLSFPANEYWEDTLFFPKSILSASSIMSVKTIHYCYRNNPESISAGRSGLLSGKKIFDYCFQAGGRLFDYSAEVAHADGRLALLIRNFAIEHYFNTLAHKLACTRISSVFAFVPIVKRNNAQIQSYIPFFRGLSRVCSDYPVMGAGLIIVIHPLYVVYRKIRKRLRNSK